MRIGEKEVVKKELREEKRRLGGEEYNDEIKRRRMSVTDGVRALAMMSRP